MSDSPLHPDWWQASDGRWHPREQHPHFSPRIRPAPPSATPAVVWTLLAAFWLWFLLPVAIYYTRRARRETEASNGMYEWSSRNLLHRPFLLWLVVFGASTALIFVMAIVGIYGDP